MINIKLPDDKPRKLVFYLAMEEFLSESCNDELFFLWHVSPTVIFGRSQVLSEEVNVAYCREKGIQYYRRKSGGGCVYADDGNIMMSYITPQVNTTDAFSHFLYIISNILHQLGYHSSKTDHNDILINGRKVSGNAYYARPNAGIVHGTLLYDVNIEEMFRAITPPGDKLLRHGVQSVRQRVINLKDIGCKLSLDELKKFIIQETCSEERILTSDEVLRIEEIEQTYLNPVFINGEI